MRILQLCGAVGLIRGFAVPRSRRLPRVRPASAAATDVDAYDVILVGSGGRTCVNQIILPHAFGAV